MIFGLADSLKKALDEMREQDRRERQAVLRGCAYCGCYECGCGAEDYHPAHPGYRAGHWRQPHKRSA